MANPFENPAISTANTPPLQQELHHKTHTTHPDTLGLLGGASDIAAFAVLDSGSTQLRPHGLDANTVFGIRETENDLLRHRQHLVEINDLQILRDHGIDIDFLREYLSNMSFLNVRHNMLIVYGSTANSIYNQMTREKSPYTKPYRPDVSDTDVLVPGAMLLHLQDRWTLAAMSAGTLGDRFTTYRYQNSAQISGEPKQRHELFAVVSDTDRDLIQIHRATNHEAPAIVLYLDLLGKLHAKLLKPVPWDEGTDPVINPYNITASGLRAVGNLLAKLGDSEVTLQEKERVIDSSSVYSQKLPMIIIKMLRGLTIHDSLDDLDLENNYDCVRELALVCKKMTAAADRYFEWHKQNPVESVYLLGKTGILSIVLQASRLLGDTAILEKYTELFMEAMQMISSDQSLLQKYPLHYIHSLGLHEKYLNGKKSIDSADLTHLQTGHLIGRWADQDRKDYRRFMLDSLLLEISDKLIVQGVDAYSIRSEADINPTEMDVKDARLDLFDLGVRRRKQKLIPVIYH